MTLVLTLRPCASHWTMFWSHAGRIWETRHAAFSKRFVPIQEIRQDRFGFLKSFLPGFYGTTMLHHPVSEGVLDWSFTLASMASPMATLDCVDAWGKTDFRGDLQSFTIPTLIIHGTADSAVPADIAGRRAADMIPGSIFREYDGAPHGLFLTHAEQVNADLLEFLAS